MTAALDAVGTVPGAVGAPALNRQAAKLLTGRAHFLADHPEPGLCHVTIARSTVAHAEIVRIDTSVALAHPDVVAVVTQADLDAAGARHMTHLLDPPARPLAWGVLASDRVRFVGEPVAAVVARSQAAAEDAVEALVIDYRELLPVVGVDAAMAAGAPLLYPEWGTNEFLGLAATTPGLETAFERSPRRLTERFESHRVFALPLETRGAQARWDPGAGRLTVLASNQQPHQLRTVIAEVCGLAETQVRVVSPHMGGGFGNKQHFSREECLVALLARITGRPVRWVEGRREALTASVHSRAQVHDVEAGYDERGRLLALRVRILSDLGNPVLYFSGVGPALVAVSSLTGAYAIDDLGWELSCVATTTCPVGAYRGFGQPEAHFMIERVMDRVAAALHLDPVEVRRVNLLPDAPRPWRGPGGQRIDVGSVTDQLDLLLERFDYDGWRRRQRDARAAGRCVGIGISTMLQGTAPTQHDTAGRFGSLEMAAMTVLPDGRVELRVGTKSQGQAHETTFAQLAGDALGISPDLIDVRDGDTDALPYGQGTWGSRSAVMGGGAILQAAATIRARLVEVAAALGHDVAWSGAVDPSVWEAVAAAAWWHPHLLPPAVGPGLTTTAVYSPGSTGPTPDGGANHDETYGAHATALAVEVDPATGEVEVLAALLVADCGTVINPAVVEGQLQGGFAQGWGAARFEEFRYRDDGQPLCTSLLDYTIPTAADTPALEVVHRPTPSELAGGFRGVGEAGIIAAPAVLASAIEDALSPLGVRLSSTRLSAEAVRAAVEATTR